MSFNETQLDKNLERTFKENKEWFLAIARKVAEDGSLLV